MSGNLDSWFTAGGSGRQADNLSQDLYKVRNDFPQYLKGNPSSLPASTAHSSLQLDVEGELVSDLLISHG